MGNQRVTFNVSGNIFETLERTLRRFPKTLLGDLEKRSTFYDELTESYFINRSSIAFEAVLYFYQSNGCLVRPPALPMGIFERECVYYEISTKYIKKMKSREGFDTILKSRVPQKQRLYPLWELLEHPESSMFARLFAFISVSCIITTIFIDCTETITGFLYKDKNGDAYYMLQNLKFTINVFFAVEFLLRLISCEDARKFLASLPNIVDVLAIFPGFLAHVVSESKLEGIYFMRALRVFRIFRLVRLSKSFHSLTVVFHILSTSLPNLLMLLICMLISIILFGSTIYYAELSDSNSPVISIPEGMWLAMVTVVSLGYGDVIPITELGKLTTSVTVIIGALTISLPLLSLGGKYFSMYTKAFDIELTLDDMKKPTDTAVEYGNKLEIKKSKKSTVSIF